MKLLLYLFCLSFYVFNLVKTDNKYKIYTKSIKCNNVNKTYGRVEKCEIKAERGTNGLVNFVYTFAKPISDGWDNLQCFYRGTSGSYQPYLINIDFNLCEIEIGIKTGNPLWKRAAEFLKDAIPGMTQGCPFKGTLNMSRWDFNKEAQKYYPPIIPEGTFMLRHRVHTLKNVTLLDIELIHQIKPTGVTDLIKLG